MLQYLLKYETAHLLVCINFAYNIWYMWMEQLFWGLSYLPAWRSSSTTTISIKVKLFHNQIQGNSGAQLTFAWYIWKERVIKREKVQKFNWKTRFSSKSETSAPNFFCQQQEDQKLKSWRSSTRPWWSLPAHHSSSPSFHHVPVHQPIREHHLQHRPMGARETGNDPIEPPALPASGKLRWK